MPQIFSVRCRSESDRAKPRRFKQTTAAHRSWPVGGDTPQHAEVHTNLPRGADAICYTPLCANDLPLGVGLLPSSPRKRRGGRWDGEGECADSVFGQGKSTILVLIQSSIFVTETTRRFSGPSMKKGTNSSLRRPSRSCPQLFHSDKPRYQSINKQNIFPPRDPRFRHLLEAIHIPALHTLHDVHTRHGTLHRISPIYLPQ